MEAQQIDVNREERARIERNLRIIRENMEKIRARIITLYQLHGEQARAAERLEREWMELEG